MTDLPTPSSELLKWRVAAELTQDAAAEQIGTSRQTYIGLEKGSKPVTAEMAVKLETATATPAERWLWWQAKIDLEKIRANGGAK